MNTQKLPRIFIWLWLIALITIGAYIRVHGADTYHYSPDEAMHTGIASGATLQDVLRFSHDEIHPPLLYVFLHYWMTFSTDEGFVRGLSLVFGILLILVYYGIGKTLNGELTGLCCAAFITFGMGCIIQSYAVRHYAMFLFFISLGYYFYLLWRREFRIGLLAVYGISAILACLTHFSALFSVFCIATCELWRLWRSKAPRAVMAQWIGVNMLIAAIEIYVYHLWQPILVPLKSYFATHTAGSFLSLSLHALFYPIATSGYILPSYELALILLFCQLWMVIAPPQALTNIAGLQRLLALNGFAYAFGMLLVLTRLYPEPGTRHSIWVLPFIIPAAGWMLAELLGWLARTPRTQVIVLVLLLAAGYASYNPTTRFHDGSEYVWTQNEWQSFTHYLDGLGSRDVIVTEKDDGIMLENLYPAMGEDALTGNHMATLVPYRNTHILFNPYYPRNYSRDLLLTTLQEAEERHMLDNADRLIFLRMAWSRSPLTDLMLCNAVAKNIVMFPPAEPSDKISRELIYSRFAVLMVVAKQPFLNDVLSPASAMRACMDGKHDMAPNLQATHL